MGAIRGMSTISKYHRVWIYYLILCAKLNSATKRSRNSSEGDEYYEGRSQEIYEDIYNAIPKLKQSVQKLKVNSIVLARLFSSPDK